MREGDQRHAQAALPPGKKPVPIVQDAGKAPGPVWAGAEYLAPTGFRSPHPAVRIELLKQLRHPAQLVGGCIMQTTFPAVRINPRICSGLLPELFVAVLHIALALY